MKTDHGGSLRKRRGSRRDANETVLAVTVLVRGNHDLGDRTADHPLQIGMVRQILSAGDVHVGRNAGFEGKRFFGVPHHADLCHFGDQHKRVFIELPSGWNNEFGWSLLRPSFHYSSMVTGCGRTFLTFCPPDGRA